MSNSQNIKNEQQNDLYITSEQLTEQWKKGELPSGWYYVEGNRVEGIYAYIAEYLNNMYRPRNSERIIAKVPSYDEYLSLTYAKEEDEGIIAEYEAENTKLKEYERIVTSYNMKPIDYEIACETVNKLLDDNKRLKHDVGNLGYKIKNQRHEIDNRLKEIEKLKELLTLCYEHLATEASVIPLNIVLKRVWEVLDERK